MEIVYRQEAPEIAAIPEDGLLAGLVEVSPLADFRQSAGISINGAGEAFELAARLNNQAETTDRFLSLYADMGSLSADLRSHLLKEWAAATKDGAQLGEFVVLAHNPDVRGVLEAVVNGSNAGITSPSRTGALFSTPNISSTGSSVDSLPAILSVDPPLSFLRARMLGSIIEKDISRRIGPISDISFTREESILPKLPPRISYSFPEQEETPQTNWKQKPIR